MDEDFKMPSAAALQAAVLAALRTLSVLIGGGLAIWKFVSVHDLAGLINYVKSSDFLGFAGALVAAGSFGFGIWRTYHKERTAKRVEQIAPAVAQEAKQSAPRSPS